MKKLLVFLMLFATFSANSQNCSSWTWKQANMAFPDQYNGVTTGWQLYAPFSDEFDGDTLDNTKWTAYNNFCHGMSDAAYFRNTPNHVKVENGKLKLSAIEEPTPVECCIWWDPNNCHDYSYSSGYIYSNNKIQYGYLEMKCYIPSSIALNPCFWLWGSTGGSYPVKQYDEIDVFERWGDPNSVPYPDRMMMSNFYHNIGDTIYGTSSKLQQTITFNTAFVGYTSIFAVEWLPHEIHFYVNGKITRSVRYSTRTDHNSDSYFTCADFEDAIPQRIDISFSINNKIFDFPDLTESFEIEYIHSYKLQEGFNYEYWPTSFSLFDPNIFKVHKSLKLGGTGHTAVIPSNQNITVWAKESIVLSKGFEVTGNTTFTARTIETGANSNLFK